MPRFYATLRHKNGQKSGSKAFILCQIPNADQGGIMNAFVKSLVMLGLAGFYGCKKDEVQKTPEEQQKEEAYQQFNTKVRALETLASDPNDDFPYKLYTNESVRVHRIHNKTGQRGAMYLYVHDPEKTYVHTYVNFDIGTAAPVNWPNEFYLCDAHPLNRSLEMNSQLANCKSFPVNEEVKKSYRAIVETLYEIVEQNKRRESTQQKIQEHKINEILRRRYELPAERMEDLQNAEMPLEKTNASEMVPLGEAK